MGAPVRDRPSGTARPGLPVRDRPSVTGRPWPAVRDQRAASIPPARGNPPRARAGAMARARWSFAI